MKVGDIVSEYAEKYVESIEKRIEKIFSKLNYDDEDKNQKRLKKLLNNFLIYTDTEPVDFLFVLLSKKRDESKTMKVVNFVCDNHHIDFYYGIKAPLIDKYMIKNVIQVIIEAGYSTDFIEKVIQNFSEHYNVMVNYDSLDFEDNSVFHTLAKSFGNSSIDIFRIYHMLIKNNLSHMDTWVNLKEESFIGIITDIVDKYEQNSTKGKEIADLILWARIMNLKDTIVYYYSQNFFSFLTLLTDDSEYNKKIISEKMTYYGDMAAPYRKIPAFDQYIQNQYGIYPVKGLLNLCVQEDIYEEDLVYSVNKLIDTGLMDINYVDCVGNDFISQAIVSGKDKKDIINLFEIALKHNVDNDILINVLRTVIDWKPDLCAYCLYKYLAGNGFNLLECDELISEDDILYQKSFDSLNKHQLKMIDIQRNVNFIKAINNELTDLGTDIRIASNVPFDKNKLIDYDKYETNYVKNELAKMIATYLYNVRCNSINDIYADNKGIEPIDLYNAIECCLGESKNENSKPKVKVKKVITEWL